MSTAVTLPEFLTVHAFLAWVRFGNWWTVCRRRWHMTCSPALPGDNALRNPVLVIEILSPSNRAETWTNVWSYTTIPSVQEILVLHSTSVGADLLRRGADGTWPERPQAIEQGELMLDSIGFIGPIAAFYRTTWLNETAQA